MSTTTGDARRSSPWTFGSGPEVASLFGALLGAVWLVAWLSLGVQIRALVGRRGLLPVADFVEAARAQNVASWLHLPTFFLWASSDAALLGGVVVGAALALAALLGLRRRLCFALSTLLYLSYVTVGRVFFSFQWDNLLLECGLLAALLPRERAAPAVHFLFRALLFKLYFESGLAKWQSPLHDWQDGSAMVAYYETAPLPTALAWTAHHLPAWWHHLESRATLVVELVLPFAIFGPRRARLAAGAAFTAFQIANAATANYGFFCYLAAALHVFVLDDGDVERLVARLRRVVRAPRRPPAPRERTPTPPRARAASAAAAGQLLVVGGYVGLSLAQALWQFTDGGPWLEVVAPVLELDQTFRLVNTYHLFGSITRERVEPELQTLGAGDAPNTNAAPDAAPGDAAAADADWTARDLWHKPGAPARAPDFVAPHQPRLDFQLWFHGLSFQRGQPPYLTALLERMCEDAPAVQLFFRDPLPPKPRAVRVVYWQYHFTTPGERRATGDWWRRERVAVGAPVLCASSPASPLP
jgi:hypothetical protein